MDQKEFERTVYHAKGELEGEWSLWERFKEKNYSASNLKEIFSFKDLVVFSHFITKTDYKDISKFLQSSPDEIINVKMLIGEELLETPIDCFMLFRKGITPEWEDKKNSKGGHFLYTLKGKSGKIINQIWLNLTYELIGESWEGSNHICGLRLLNKLKSNEIIVKIEIWIDFSDKEKLDVYETMEDQSKVFENIKEKFVANLAETMDTKPALLNLETNFEYHQKSHSKPYFHGNKRGYKGSGGGGGYNFRGGRSNNFGSFGNR